METEECVITSMDCLELFASIHLTRNLHIAAFGEHTPYTDALLDVLDSVHQHAFSTYCHFECLEMVDTAIADIPHEEANERCFQRPKRFQRINEFLNDNEARNMTNFDKDQLRRIDILFDLPLHVVTKNRYAFHRQEVLIYYLMKVKEGKSHFDMAKTTTQGCEIRMGEAFNHMVKFLDERYYDLIGPRGLEMWANEFPKYAEAIRDKLSTDKLWWDGEEELYTVEHCACWFEPGSFNVAGFLDCKYYECTTVGSGPDNSPDEHIGAQRRPNWYAKQRAFYTGHKAIHGGVQMLSFNIPTGITAAVFGPCSVRHHDTKLIEWSWVDDTLYWFMTMVLGLAANSLFTWYGDSAYGGFYNCIRKRHQDGQGAAPLNERQRKENRAMKRGRISIEWSYALVTKL